MTNEEIIAGNKLIALSKYSNADIRQWVEEFDKKIPDRFCLNVLDYHKNIASLMDVLESIEKNGCIIEISISLGRNCRIYNIRTGKNFYSEDMSLINACYKAVLEYLISD
ncbi:MAG: hypothetical protein ACOC22_01205 [bacterium]